MYGPLNYQVENPQTDLQITEWTYGKVPKYLDNDFTDIHLLRTRN